MAEFDDLRAQAEKLAGKEAVKEAERQLQRKPDDRREILTVDRAVFDPAGPEALRAHRPAPSIEVSGARMPRAGSSSERLIGEAIKGEYRYSTLGLVLGLASIVSGTALGLNGVAGSTSWTARVLGLESQINDAAPGVVLFIVGVFYVWITKPKVHLKDLLG